MIERRARQKSRKPRLGLAEQWAGGMFLLGLTASLWMQPAGTYSWLWDGAKDSGHRFAVGILDITESVFGDKWRVIEGGSHAVDLSRMIPGDARQLEATLSSGESDLEFVYKIVARVTEAGKPEDVPKLEEVLRVRIETGGSIVYDGLVRGLHQEQPGLQHVNGTEDRFPLSQQSKTFAITVYLPKEGVDHSFQALAGNLEIRFLAKQATPDAIFSE
ncbi:hypothetical protein [Brevibacillus borstelensis]|uniref:hypothetical protein n=1 Tax=Brevibacillus borstelensis TaxID=45462 RepID=UPI0030BF4239